MFALNAAEDEREERALVWQAKSFFAWQRNLPCYAKAEGGNRAVLPYKQS